MSCPKNTGCLCDQCAALCCRYFALPIDNPKSARQYDDIRWYLCHENVVVFIEDKQWYLGIMSRCKHLRTDNRCGIYERRPRVCREYTTDNCDYHGGEYDFEQLFTSAEQLEAYAKEKLKRLRDLKRRRRQRLLLTGQATRPTDRAKPQRPRRRARAKTRISLSTVHVQGALARVNGNGNGNVSLSLPILRI